jgi:hypothetical protein
VGVSLWGRLLACALLLLSVSVARDGSVLELSLSVAVVEVGSLEGSVDAEEPSDFLLLFFRVELSVSFDSAFADSAELMREAFTIGRIFFRVASEIPARRKSATDLYGRLSMIFFAVASPTPGSASNSDCEAVFTSTFDADCSCFCEDFFLSFADANVLGARPSTSNNVNSASAIRFRDAILSP